MMILDMMQGRLRMHQDKDESRESLRAGIPVVSFSIGDTAEFLYGHSRDEDSAQVMMTRKAQQLVCAVHCPHHLIRLILVTIPLSVSLFILWHSPALSQRTCLA